MEDGSRNEAAFTELYISYYPRIYAAAFSLLRQQQAAEDITQQVFMRLWEGRGTIHADNLEGYLVTMAKNAILNHFRAQSVRARYRRYLRERLELAAGNVEDIVIDRQQQQVLEQAIRQLPARQQEAWRLSREQGLTYLEIARHMRISKDSVKELLQKASAVIRSVIGRITLWLAIVFFFLSPPPQTHQQGVNIKEPIARSQ